MMMLSSFVVAITATRRRQAELRRLMDSLDALHHPLRALIVIDNGNEAPTEQLCARPSGYEIHYTRTPRNLGCGGALRLGEERALEQYAGRMTHFWILDDDVVVSPSCLGELLGALARERAAIAVPMILDGNQRIGWPSGLLDPGKVRALRDNTQPEFLARCGPEPVPFSWTQGICVLGTRATLDQFGLHAVDYWLRGEDFEWSLRITARARGVFVPTATVQHLMPPAASDLSAREMEYRKQCAMVQNVTYLGLHVPHGRRLFWKIPGRYFRHFKNWGISPRTLRDTCRLFWQGAILARPAGSPSLSWPMPR